MTQIYSDSASADHQNAIDTLTMPANEPKSRGEIILYQTEDGRTRVECRFADENIWLTQRLLAELYQVGVNTINHHIKEILADGELTAEATIRNYRIVQTGFVPGIPTAI